MGHKAFSGFGDKPVLQELHRRGFLFRSGVGLGSLALSYLLQEEGLKAATDAPSTDPLAPRAPHRSPRAKSCIFLFMAGGPGHMDTFDPKPKLSQYHGTPASGKDKGSNLLYIGSPFGFSRHGQSGLEVSEIFPHVATCVDDLAVVRSLYTDSDNHTAGTLLMNLGRPVPGSPAMARGSCMDWATKTTTCPPTWSCQINAFYTDPATGPTGIFLPSTRGPFST